MKTDITMHYVLMFSYELRKDEWKLLEHEYCITCDNMYEDMRIIIPKQIDEFCTIDLWCSGTLLYSFDTVIALDMQLKELLQ